MIELDQHAQESHAAAGDREKGELLRRLSAANGLSMELKVLAGAQHEIRESIAALSADFKSGFEQLRKDLGEIVLRHPVLNNDDPSSNGDDQQSKAPHDVNANQHNDAAETVGNGNLYQDIGSVLTKVSRYHLLDDSVEIEEPRRSVLSEGSGTASSGVQSYALSDRLQHGVIGLPSNWPTGLTARLNLATRTEQASRRVATVAGRTGGSLHRRSKSASELDIPSWRTIFLHWGVMNPNSLPRICFEACGITVLLYDLTTTPYLLAWDLGDTESSIRYLGVLVAVYWTLDMGLSFNTGFYDHGELNLDRIKIARKYLKSWLLLDFLLIVCDWLSIVFPELSVMGVLKAGKLLRLRRLFGLVDNFNDRTLSESTRLVFRVASIVVAIFFFNHFMCCTWYALGRIAPSDTGAHWLDTYLLVGVEDRAYAELSPAYQYFTVLHWYFAQMTAGNQTINCYNTAERAFNIVGLLLGLFISCSLVSSLSTTMLEIQMANKDQKTKLRTLTQFLRENNVEPQVAVLVQRQVRERIHERDRLTQADVPALALISSHLRKQLRLVIFSPHITRHPLFRLWSSMDDSALENLCSEAVHFKFLRAQDDLFKAGITAEDAYLFHSGMIQYVQEPEVAPVEQKTTTSVSQGTWLSEVALWVADWTHVGSAEAVGQCKVIVVHAPAVMQTIPKYGVVQLLTKEYHSAFHRRVMAAVPPHAAWPSDLGVSLTEYSDLVPLMHPEAQIAIGLNALDQMQSRMWKKAWFAEGIDNLREEIFKGKSVVVLNELGEPERLASVLALRIKRADDSLLVKIGKWDMVQTESACQLPGGKLESGEMLRDAMIRLLETKLKPLAGIFEIVEIENQTKLQESKEYQMRSKYLLNVCFGHLTAKLKAQTCNASNGGSSSRTNSGQPKVSTSSREEAQIDEFLNRSGSIQSKTSSADRSSSSRRKRKSSVVQHLEWKDVAGKDVFCFKVDDTGKWDLYTWLSPMEFDYLSSTSGENLLFRWLNAINFDALLADLDTSAHDNSSLGDLDGTHSQNSTAHVAGHVHSTPIIRVETV